MKTSVYDFCFSCFENYTKNVKPFLSALDLLSVLPDALVEELAFGKSVFLLDTGEPDSFLDGNFPADGLRVDERLLAYGRCVFLEHLEAEMVYPGSAQVRQQFQGRLRLANKERVAAFRVALQKVTLALVVENFDLVLGTNLAAFGEPPTGSERTGECAVFGMECGHVLVEREFHAVAIDIA